MLDGSIASDAIFFQPKAVNVISSRGDGDQVSGHFDRQRPTD